MLGVNERLLRIGGNQPGVLVMATGLIAYFIEPGSGGKELGLILVGFILGFVLYMLSVTTWQPKVDAGKKTANPPRR